MKKEVSVVIPSFNRGYLLKKTIPTYVQELVGEIIVVNDASTDNTVEVLENLKRKIPIMRYITLPCNSKQTAAKNKGILNAKYPYIYFGDDDSIITPNTINYLMETLNREKADAVGAKALYMNKDSDLENINKFIENNIKKAYSKKDIFCMNDFNEICFDWDVKVPIQVPFCPACALVKTEIAKNTLFDTIYIGNAYREETDFFTRISKSGHKVFYDSRGIQINLPRKFNLPENKKGQSIIDKILNISKFYYYNINNTFIYFDRHYYFLKKEFDLKGNLFYFKLDYLYMLIKNFIINHMNKEIK